MKAREILSIMAEGMNRGLIEREMHYIDHEITTPFKDYLKAVSVRAVSEYAISKNKEFDMDRNVCEGLFISGKENKDNIIGYRKYVDYIFTCEDGHEIGFYELEED